MVSNETFAEKLKRGNEGELTISALLQARGWWVLPTWDFSGSDGESKAPALQAQGERLVIPDLLIAKDGGMRWCEVKLKERPTFTRITGRLEHGIALRHHNDYRRVATISGVPVFLFVIEESSGDVLFARLDDLDALKRVYTGDQMDRGGTVFFPRDAFNVLTNMTDTK